MTVRDVVILGAARTPIGRFGGSFKDVHAAELGMTAAKAAMGRAGIVLAGGIENMSRVPYLIDAADRAGDFAHHLEVRDLLDRAARAITRR